MENSNFNVILQQLYAALTFELFEVNLLAYEFFATKIFQFCSLNAFSPSCYYLLTTTNVFMAWSFEPNKQRSKKKTNKQTMNKQSYKTLATTRITVLSELHKKNPSHPEVQKPSSRHPLSFHPASAVEYWVPVRCPWQPVCCLLRWHLQDKPVTRQHMQWYENLDDDLHVVFSKIHSVRAIQGFKRNWKITSKNSHPEKNWNSFQLHGHLKKRSVETSCPFTWLPLWIYRRQPNARVSIIYSFL